MGSDPTPLCLSSIYLLSDGLCISIVILGLVRRIETGLYLSIVILGLVRRIETGLYFTIVKLGLVRRIETCMRSSTVQNILHYTTLY